MTDCTAFNPVDKIPNQTKAHNMYSSPHDSQEETSSDGGDTCLYIQIQSCQGYEVSSHVKTFSSVSFQQIKLSMLLINCTFECF